MSVYAKPEVEDMQKRVATLSTFPLGILIDTATLHFVVLVTSSLHSSFHPPDP